MRLLGTIILVLAVGFMGLMGYYWLRDGSLESAGREMDQDLAEIGETTAPIKDSLGEVDGAAKDAVNDATDGDDRT